MHCHWIKFEQCIYIHKGKTLRCTHKLTQIHILNLHKNERKKCTYKNRFQNKCQNSTRTKKNSNKMGEQKKESSVPVSRFNFFTRLKTRSKFFFYLLWLFSTVFFFFFAYMCLSIQFLFFSLAFFLRLLLSAEKKSFNDFEYFVARPHSAPVNKFLYNSTGNKCFTIRAH